MTFEWRKSGAPVISWLNSEVGISGPNGRDHRRGIAQTVASGWHRSRFRLQGWSKLVFWRPPFVTPLCGPVEGSPTSAGERSRGSYSPRWPLPWLNAASAGVRVVTRPSSHVPPLPCQRQGVLRPETQLPHRTHNT